MDNYASNQSSHINCLSRVICSGSFLPSLIFFSPLSRPLSHLISTHKIASQLVSAFPIFQSLKVKLNHCDYIHSSLKTSKGATLPRGGFSSRLITDLCQMDHKTTSPHSLWASFSPLLLTNTFEMHKRADTPVTFLLFTYPRLKRIWMIRSFQHVPLHCHIPFIWGSWLETTQIEIPKAAHKRLLLPLILVVFWQNLPFIRISDIFLNFFPWTSILRYRIAQFTTHAPQILEMSVCKIQCEFLTLYSMPFLIYSHLPFSSIFTAFPTFTLDSSDSWLLATISPLFVCIHAATFIQSISSA